ncbi:ATP-dependent DNA helicase [Cellulomonas alba]|uniref:DNA 3'-5' helicase n=1 Tax=Cellulomonas alba TaxID=3053467 RepID=A0ABT7SDH8_9CELL|nr:ATP-dependent DNA helicase [Cellulomonas alba]MDM7854191.1 ATP-dependent DNA helicase [Cellulomonas alba]
MSTTQAPEVLLSARQIAALLGGPGPTDEQVRVIEAPLAPALVVAGAGSGKTETMAARVVWLLANGVVAPDQVLGLTFTRKAAGELQDRVRLRLRRLARAAADAGVTLPGPSVADDLLGGLSRPTVATYNSYAASLVVDHALRLGLDPSARLLGEAAQWQLAADVVEAWLGDLDTDAATSTVTEAVLALSGALDEHLLDPDEARRRIDGIVEAIEATPGSLMAEVRGLVRSLGERARVLDLVAEYRARKRAADAIDFGDQVALAARLARDVPEVGAAERDRFRVVLLDEYQDTSYAQLELLRALFGDGHPVTAVGDPQQSIYGWRGASAGGLERFPATFRAVDADGTRRSADVHWLSTSWRNDRAILDAANRIAAPLRAAAAARVEVPVLTARPDAGPGRVHAHVAATVEDEARAVARFVKERWRPAGSDQQRVTAAVLCRKRSQFGALRRALRAEDLPVEVVGLGGLLAAPEVVDLVAVLQAAHDPTRGDALVRLLTGARTRLGAADLHALAAWAADQTGRANRRERTGEEGAPVQADVVDERSIVDALDAVGEHPEREWTSRSGRALSPAGRLRVAELARVLRTLRAHAYLPVPELVAEAERLLGLDIELAARSVTAPARARAQLDAFRDVAVEFAQSSDHPTLGGFLAWLEAAEERENGLDLPVVEPDPDAVQLITVHGAKGLEWDVVAVAGLVDGGLPATATQGKDGPKDSAWLKGLGSLPYPLRGDRDDLPSFEYAGAADGKDLERRRQAFLQAAGEHEVAEERRLAYVALTRARSELLLSAAWWGDGVRPRPISLFLDELAVDGLIEIDAWADAPTPVDGKPEQAAGDPAVWPVDPFGTATESRRAAVERAATWVRAAAGDVGSTDLTGRWAALADRLLDEQERASAPLQEVELPSHLSASALVRLAADPDEFALGLRRPVPSRPSPQARRGTQFHAWVEGWFGRAALVDVDELPGADDETAPTAPDEAALRVAFLASPWARREPVAVEVDVETSVDGYVLRSRIDAVFVDDDRSDLSPDEQGVVVVDWKTGAPPSDPRARAAREIQLAVYRLAWSRWSGVPVDRVRAAFCYVATGTTVYPDRLMGEDEIVALLRRAVADRRAAPDSVGNA